MQIQRKLSVRQRAVSFLLAILMILMCIPSTLTSTIATGPMGGGLSGFNSGRNVLTNVSVSFYDSKFNAITEADSGELFYLSVQLAGNNVNEPFGKDNFRLEISDNNLLLPNFAGNGFKDGAVYNGFTLHYDEATGKRYLEYNIRNGDTKMIRLQAKFANGTTPDGMKETVKLIQTSSGKTISNTITANSNLAWSQNKSQDKNMLSGDAFKNGGSVTVNYTLSASSNNANKSKGAWFASGLHFVDNLKIPDGISAEITKEIVEQAIKNAGFTKYEVLQADAEEINFWVYSKDETREMDSVNITLPVKFTCANPVVSITEEGVKVDNAVTVTVTGVGDDEKNPKDVGNSSVSLSVTKPTIPKSNLTIAKKAEEPTEISYDDAEGWTTEADDNTKKTREVTYTITVGNTGDADAENVVLQETPQEGIVIKSVTRTDGGTCTWNETDNTITIGKVPANTPENAPDAVEITITAELTATGEGTFENKVSENSTHKESSATIKVNQQKANIGAYKTGYVNSEGNYEYDPDKNDEIHYTITVFNSGDKDGKANVEDKLPAGVTWTKVILNGIEKDLTATTDETDEVEDIFTEAGTYIDGIYRIKVPVSQKQGDKNGEYTIEFVGTVTTDAPDKIQNQATVNNKPTNNTELKKSAPNLDVTKKATTVGDGSKEYLDKDGGEQTVTYEIVVSNTGKADATNLTIEEIPDVGMTIDESVNIATGKDKNNNDKTKLNGVTDLGNLTASYDATTNKITINNGGTPITSLAVGDKITLVVTATINPGDNSTKDGYNNGVTVSASGVDPKSDYELVYAKTPPKEMSVEKKLISVNDTIVPENTQAGIGIGDEVVYQIKITNPAEKTADGSEIIEGIYLFDGANCLKFVTTEKPTVTDEDGNPIFTTDEDGNQTQIKPIVKYSSGTDEMTCFITGVNLAGGESIILQYTAKLNLHWCNGTHDFDGPCSDTWEAAYKWRVENSGTKRYPETRYDLETYGTRNNEAVGVYNYTLVGEAYDQWKNGSWSLRNDSYSAEALIYNPIDNKKVNITKELKSDSLGNGTSLNLTEMTEQQIKDARFNYTLKITGENNDYKEGKVSIVDRLPANMELVGDITAKYNDKEIKGIKPDLSEKGLLKFEFETENAKLNADDGEITVTYALKFTNAKAKEFAETDILKSTEFKNRAIVTLDNGKSKSSEEVVFTASKKSPAPGFAKKAVASFAGKVMDNDVEYSRVENGYITAGDSLIWDLVVYNGDNTSDTVADLDLGNATITDIVPSVYQYDKMLSATIYPLTVKQEDGTYGYSKGIEATASSVGALFEYSAGTDATTTVKDNGDGTFTLPAGFKLEANQCLVIRVLTINKDEQETEGVITNRGYLTTDKEYSQNIVVAGEPKGKEIWNSANYNIVGLTTESWKTIHYEKNTDHDGVNYPHIDPKTDTGYSREATHNYVQGMQGEKVTYELHIKNTSPLPLESWTMIDRLPYIGDIGLVSGFERSSAFGVMMDEVSDIKIISDEIDAETGKNVERRLTRQDDYVVSYSNDKTTVLTEYSKDWFRGTSGEMQWSPSKTDATIDFRVAFNDNDKTIVQPREEIVITFTGIVPAYVANTGEDNIAWNSFAYAYQCPDIFGDDYVMVAEPAKVGVWVEETTAGIEIQINKTSNTDGTFYFALFDKKDANTGNRLSDIIAITIPTGEKTGSTSMKVSIEDLVATTSLQQGDNFYVVEVDKYGNALKGYDTKYENQEISTDTTEKVTVNVTNTENVGQITVNKTVTEKVENDFEKDTFYFALYTLDLATNRYVRYDDVPVEAITINDITETGTLTFTNVPVGEKFYVLECNAKGVLEDSAEKAQGTYTSNSGATYAVTGNADPVEVGKTVTINNEKLVDYSITVMKSLVLNEDNADFTRTFKVGLFLDELGTKPAKDADEENIVKTIAPGQEVVFKNLNPKTTYYVFELDQGNNVIT
ncbi:MAG: DUF11 domain-containing protein, partial [Oscillospiraceae bacterium]|nr:DUF11 domain-containing protein [Oscillospiraceae bacterium]